MIKSVFVSVGTTQFDELISTVDQMDNLMKLKEMGYNKIIMQTGKGKYTPINAEKVFKTLEIYRFKENISNDMRKADLIISHAGKK